MANLFESLTRRYREAVVPSQPAIQQPAAAPAPIPAESTPSTTAETLVLEQPTSPPVTLTVVTGHNNFRASEILAGIVGTRRDGVFTIDKTYAQVSYLFTLASSGMTEGVKTVDICLPNAQAGREFLMNMLAASGRKWEQMYAQVGQSMGQQGDLVQNMLTGERANVNESCQRVIAEAGLTAYECPVAYEVLVPQTLASERSDVATEAQLAAMGTIVPLSIQTPHLEGGGPLQPSTTVASPELCAATKGHDGGFEMDVNGVVKVLASSPANARAVLEQLLVVSRQGIVQNVLTLTPVSIQNVTQTPYETEPDGDYDRDN